VTFSRRLLRAELIAQLALATIVVLIIVTYGAIAIVAERNPVVPTAKEALSFVIAGATLFHLYALGPVALYGAPLYALADTYGRASWATTLAIGSLPGLALLLASPSLKTGIFAIGPAMSVLVLAAGLLVSALTHFLYKKRRARESVA
jgi:hypothetical protein